MEINALMDLHNSHNHIRVYMMVKIKSKHIDIMQVIGTSWITMNHILLKGSSGIISIIQRHSYNVNDIMEDK
jgi:hypothetical protein